jgi:hypothetical protein
MYEDGKLHVYPLMENGIGGGLVKGLAKILGAGGKSASTALKGARDLTTTRSGVETFVRGNGDKLFYDSARNEFAVLRQDGILRTYFRPTEGRQYWLEQLAKG